MTVCFYSYLKNGAGWLWDPLEFTLVETSVRNSAEESRIMIKTQNTKIHTL